MRTHGVQPAAGVLGSDAGRAHDHRRMMWINADRVVYCGLLGAPAQRRFGGHSVYVSLSGTHRIRIENGDWQECRLSVVPSHTHHQIVSGERLICSILVEPETVDMRRLPRRVAAMRGAVLDEPFADRMKHAALRLTQSCGAEPVSTDDFDRIFFDGELHRCSFDPRVQAAINRIRIDPQGHHPASRCAGLACLSETRFLHLFSQQAGMPFRVFRAWKRARTFLYYVTREYKLSDVAMDAGYPDATHFSHSIRQVYGLTPRSMSQGSRSMALYADASAGHTSCISPAD